MIRVRIRKIELADNPSIARIIRTVMPEFGAGGAGFAIHDPEVDSMYESYSNPTSGYFVAEINQQIFGGGGFSILPETAEGICELKKMYFLPAARGKGLGQLVLTAAIEAAKSAGYTKMYLETFNTMESAMKLYERNGFTKIPGCMGNTGHFACDRFYIRDL